METKIHKYVSRVEIGSTTIGGNPRRSKNLTKSTKEEKYRQQVKGFYQKEQVQPEKKANLWQLSRILQERLLVTLPSCTQTNPQAHVLVISIEEENQYKPLVLLRTTKKHYDQKVDRE